MKVVVASLVTGALFLTACGGGMSESEQDPNAAETPAPPSSRSCADVEAEARRHLDEMEASTSEGESSRAWDRYADQVIDNPNCFDDETVEGVRMARAQMDDLAEDLEGVPEEDSLESVAADIMREVRRNEPQIGMRARGFPHEASPLVQAKFLLDASWGHKEIDCEKLEMTRPGTIVYDNLMAITGDDPNVVDGIIYLYAEELGCW